MLKIGEFSKLSMITVKALRFYEKKGILVPSTVDQWTGYRYYETNQLETAARIKALRQLDFSVEEIRECLISARPVRELLEEKENELRKNLTDISHKLSIIKYLSEEKEMKYQAVIKQIPEAIVYYEEARLENYSDAMRFIPESGEECRRINPNLKCTEPQYEFCEYLDGEYKERDILIRHSQAVTEFGNENERIKFRKIPAVKAISIYHKGSYERLGEAYSYIMNYAETNGYKACGLARECYIDGIWNKESVDEWLTEIQLPIE